MIIRIRNKAERDKILSESWKRVEKGELAELHVVDENGVTVKWLGAKNVLVKCSHCGQITNKSPRKVKSQAKAGTRTL